MKLFFFALLLFGHTLAKDLSTVRYLLWTRSNSEDNGYYSLQVFDADNLAASPFDGSKPTYFVYHGWTDQGLNDFITQAKTDILTIEDANYISVDWQELAASPVYEPAVENVYLVSNQTAEFIHWLGNEASLTLTKVHIWGHSLGAHCAGITGYYVQSYGNGSVRRVTGLDPAAPSFIGKNATERIDKSHATFVDIIHTNAATLDGPGAGLIGALGHVDFYPNGGMNQPGCVPPITGQLGDVMNGCSHGRAPEYFVESILGSPAFVSYPCNSNDDFENGSCSTCSQGCLDMGFHLHSSSRGTYFLTTSNESPYAVGDTSD